VLIVIVFLILFDPEGLTTWTRTRNRVVLPHG